MYVLHATFDTHYACSEERTLSASTLLREGHARDIQEDTFPARVADHEWNAYGLQFELDLFSIILRTIMSRLACNNISRDTCVRTCLQNVQNMVISIFVLPEGAEHVSSTCCG